MTVFNAEKLYETLTLAGCEISGDKELSRELSAVRRNVLEFLEKPNPLKKGYRPRGYERIRLRDTADAVADKLTEIWAKANGNKTERFDRITYDIYSIARTIHDNINNEIKWETERRENKEEPIIRMDALW